MPRLWCLLIVSVEIYTHVYGGVFPNQCTLVEIRSLLDGCDTLKNLNVTSVAGTVVDDHNCDVLLPKQVFAEEPIIRYDIADSKKFYTIMMLDPEAPPQVEGEFYLHMLKCNVPGSVLKVRENNNGGVEYRVYKPPMPARGTGPHRYMFLLFEQAEGTKFSPSVPPSRKRLSLGVWLRNKALCGPVAGTQFRSQY